MKRNCVGVYAFFLLGAASFLGFPRSAPAQNAPPDIQSIEITVLQDLAERGGEAWGVNDSGLVVGVSYARDGHEHAVLWLAPSRPIDLGTLGGMSSEARGINNFGEIVGFSETASGDYHAFLIRPKDRNGDGDPDIWIQDDDHDGTNDLMMDLGTLGGRDSYAYGLNDAGMVVGAGHKPGDTISHGILWRQNGVVDLGALGTRNSGARAVNEKGVIVGFSYVVPEPGNDIHGVRWVNETINDLGDFLGSGTDAYDINDDGLIAGRVRETTPGGIWSHPALWSGAKWALLDNPEALEGSAYCVNSYGEIGGYVRYSLSSLARPALWQNGVLIDENLFEMTGNTGLVNDINDLGWMAGYSGLGKELDRHDAVIWKIIESVEKTKARIEDVRDRVEEMVSDLRLTRGQGDALKSKLDGLEALLEDMSRVTYSIAALGGDAWGTRNEAAVNLLNAFIRQVEAFIKAGILSGEDGWELIEPVLVIISRIGG